MAVCVEHIDEAEPRKADGIVLRRILNSIGDPEFTVDVLNSERRKKIAEEAVISEGAAQRCGLEVRVEDIDFSCTKIRGVQERLSLRRPTHARSHRQTLVHGARRAATFRAR